MVPEGGYDMIPKYVFDGCLLAGETAGLCMNMGYQVRGMDFAVASGQMAAKAAVEALGKGDVDEALSVNKYEVDEGAPHIVLAEDLKSSPRGALLVNDSSLARVAGGCERAAARFFAYATLVGYAAKSRE